MTREQWAVEPRSGCCAVTGRPIQEGEEFYTVLFEEGESFRRADFSLDAWTQPPENAFCHFKTRMPVKEKRRKLLVNDEILFNFFERLADEEEPIRVQFRFVLALILMRKRRLRYEGSKVEGGVEVWDMVHVGDHSEHRVVNPRLTDGEIEGVSKQLSAVLHEDMGEWAGSEMGVEPDPRNET